jgi:hypothetical protein
MRFNNPTPFSNYVVTTQMFRADMAKRKENRAE